MSDYNDYKENLAFPPKAIGSQDELPEQGRKSDVLIEAINNAESWFDLSRKLEEELLIYDEKLAIALKALVDIEDEPDAETCRGKASNALLDMDLVK